MLPVPPIIFPQASRQEEKNHSLFLTVANVRIVIYHA